MCGRICFSESRHIGLRGARKSWAFPLAHQPIMQFALILRSYEHARRTRARTWASTGGLPRARAARNAWWRR
jgi:hypothetical protein